MSCRSIIICLGLFFALAGTANAATLTARIDVNAPSPNPFFIQRAERAITHQVNRQVGPIWHTPDVRFVQSGPADIVVNLDEPGAVNAACGEDADGCHAPAENGVISIYVNRWAGCQGFPVGHCQGFQDWPPDLSHEIIETLIDPTGNLLSPGGIRLEPCDPVDDDGYQVHGIDVSDFVFPGWFVPGTRGKLDWMGEVHRAMQLGASGYALEGNGTMLGGTSDLS